MNDSSKLLHRKFLISLICILFLVLFSFLIVDGYLSLERDEKIYTSETKDMIGQRISSLFFEVNLFPQDIGDNLLFFSELSILNDIFNSTYEDKEKGIKDLENNFLAYIKRSTSYYRLRYIDENGEEITRAEFDGTEYYLVSKNKLQNRKKEDYFSETMKLEKGLIYLSQLGLSVENGIIENRGTKENPEYVPIMKAATPVFSDEGMPKGIIVFDIYADYFLEEIRRAKRGEEKMVLINKNGDYLCHPNREKEFAFMFNREDNFFKDYPDVSRDFLLDLNEKVLESDDLIFSFKHIYPVVGNARVYNLDQDYLWILITISDKTNLNNNLNDIKNSYLYSSLFSGIIIFLIITLIFFLIFKSSGCNSAKGGKR